MSECSHLVFRMRIAELFHNAFLCQELRQRVIAINGRLLRTVISSLDVNNFLKWATLTKMGGQGSLIAIGMAP